MYVWTYEGGGEVVWGLSSGGVEDDEVGSGDGGEG